MAHLSRDVLSPESLHHNMENLEDCQMSDEIKYDLHTAVFNGDCKYILQNISSFQQRINERNRKGWTPLMYACSVQNENIIYLLIEKGASIDNPGIGGLTPLMIAAQVGCIRILDLLLRNFTTEHSILDIEDEKGWTPLFYAVHMCQEFAVQHLLDLGADVNKIAKNGESLLMVAISGYKTQISLIEILLSAGASLLYTSQKEENAFTAALKSGNIQILQFLKSTEEQDLYGLLECIGLEKYAQIFKDHHIAMIKFLTLKDDDLITIGIERLGPRKKMLMAIEKFKTKKEL